MAHQLAFPWDPRFHRFPRPACYPRQLPRPFLWCVVSCTRGHLPNRWRGPMICAWGLKLRHPVPQSGEEGTTLCGDRKHGETPHVLHGSHSLSPTRSRDRDDISESCRAWKAAFPGPAECPARPGDWLAPGICLLCLVAHWLKIVRHPALHNVGGRADADMVPRVTFRRAMCGVKTGIPLATQHLVHPRAALAPTMLDCCLIDRFRQEKSRSVTELGGSVVSLLPASQLSEPEVCR
jgi:hypothetical protein